VFIVIVDTGARPDYRSQRAYNRPGVGMKAFVTFLIALGFVPVAVAQTADDYRGGWRTDKGEAHTYEFSIRGDKVRGIYCTYCADATTLAFVDGILGADGIAFVVTHVKANGRTAYQDKATARLDHGNLIVTGRSGAPGGGQVLAHPHQRSTRARPAAGNRVSTAQGSSRSRRENQSAGSGSDVINALHSARPMEVSVDGEGRYRDLAGLRHRGAQAVLHH